MKKSLIIFVLLFCFSANLSSQPVATGPVVTIIKLPEPDLNGKVSLEQAIKNRRSIRQFTAEPLKINQIGQLCWSAQGITDPNRGLRTAPSAGALYPIQLYVVLPDGLYLYYPQDHSLEKKSNGDIRPMLYTAAFKQQVVQNSPCSFVIAGSIKKIEAKYRGRGEKFTYLEAGHIAQNIHLQAVALGLGSVPVGSFDPKSIAGICKLTEDLEPLYLICTGNPIEKPSLEPVIASVPAAVPAARPVDDIQTKRVVIIVASRYFDDAEFFDTEEALQIAGIQPVIASSVIGEIKGIVRNNVTATVIVKDIKVDDYDAFIFIGGQSFREYFDNKNVLKLVQAANEKKKILAAIDTAAGIFAYADIVRGKNVTSFPSQRGKFINVGANWENKNLVIDGHLITASGPEAARMFGTAVLRTLRQQSE
jgi:SagB-type dehydrogenase family enzyme